MYLASSRTIRVLLPQPSFRAPRLLLLQEPVLSRDPPLILANGLLSRLAKWKSLVKELGLTGRGRGKGNDWTRV